MKTLLLFALTLASAQVHAQSVLFEKFTLQDMNASKSAYVKADLRYPLGEVVGARLMWRLLENGFKNVTIETPAQMPSADSSELYYGVSRPGAQQQLSTFIKQAHSSDFTVTLKFTINSPTKKFLGPVTPEDTELFYEMYRQYIGGYAKLAQKVNVEEIVLGSNLEKLVCSHPQLIQGLLRNLTRVFTGRVRFDSSSLAAAQNAKACAEQAGLKFDGYGVDLRNPKLDEANAVLAAGFQISYLGFDGDAQVQFNQLTTVLNTLNKPATAWGLTLAHFSTDPAVQGPFDTSDTILGKISEEAVHKWLHSF